MPKPRSKTWKAVAGIALSFAGLAGAIIFLSVTETISVGMAKLMLIALLALYIGFGFLIAVYRFIGKLD
jgi:hypothetical protein